MSTGTDSVTAAGMVPDPAARVAARYREVNGEHPMTPADDAYVDEWFTDLETACRGRAEAPDEVRTEMLARRLPLPSYVRSDGTQMVPRDYFALVDEVGGVESLEKWFRAQWSDQQHAEEEWQGYVSGQYVCLKTVTPAMMVRKDELIAQIREALAQKWFDSAEGLERLHAIVDDLDAVLADFAAYDRLRFHGPVSRDLYVDAVRQAHPRGPAQG